MVDRLLERFSLPGDQEVALLRAVAFLDYSPSAKSWHRRLAARAPRSATTRRSPWRPATCSGRR